MVTRQMFYKVRYINLVFHSCNAFHISRVTCSFVLGPVNNSTFCYGLRICSELHVRCNPRRFALSTLRIDFNIICILHQDHVDKRSFSFWKWFFGALDVVSRRLLDEWKDGQVNNNNIVVIQILRYLATYDAKLEVTATPCCSQTQSLSTLRRLHLPH